MTARTLPASGRVAVENELLAQLGLPTSASPEDVDHAHQAITEYLAAAPAAIGGWAHAEAAALDQAYLQLTDPIGLEGSALSSPKRSPAVAPGGPATPPARRELRGTPDLDVAAEPADTTDVAEDATDDIDELFASVTPSAHRDTRGRERPARAATAAPAAARSRPRLGGLRNRLLVAAAVVAAIAGVGAIYNLGAANARGTDPATAAQPSAGAPAIDEAKVASLMAKIQANPTDKDTLLALANEFYAGEQFDVAGSWLDKLLALDPKNVQALLARGAVSFNTGDMTSAEKTWNQVVAIDPKNVEAHYDLGFLYLNSTTPDMAKVRAEWTKVVELGPGTDLAKTVQAHLDQLAQASLVPSGSPAASAGESSPPSSAPSPAPSGSALP